jgi:type II secretory pathway component PulF
VAIGEKSGKLVENLEYLSANMAKSYEFKKKVTSALMYPVMILSAAAIAGIILATFVLPKMVEMFKSLDVELPLATKILIAIADIFQTSGIFIITGMILLFAGGSFLVRTAKIKPIWHEFLLRLPLVGGLLTQIQVALICRNMGIMLESGLPISDTLTIAAKATENRVFKKYLISLNKTVEEGKGLGQEMTNKKYAHIPLIVSRMVQVGEKTGKLDESFSYLAEFFEEEVDDEVKNLGTVIEPVMLVIIAFIVGFIAFAIITPIYALTSGIHS